MMINPLFIILAIFFIILFIVSTLKERTAKKEREALALRRASEEARATWFWQSTLCSSDALREVSLISSIALAAGIIIHHKLTSSTKA
jgi:hypothetical protein